MPTVPASLDRDTVVDWLTEHLDDDEALQRAVDVLIEPYRSRIHVDGMAYTSDDLTFREQREMREVIRSLAPHNDIDQATEAEIFPAMIYIIRKRENADYDLERALDAKPADLRAPADEADPSPRRAKK